MNKKELDDVVNIIKKGFKKLQHVVQSVIVFVLVFLYIVYEELIYETIGYKLVAWFKTLKFFDKLETLLKHQPPIVILILFLSTFLVAEVIGILSGIIFIVGGPFVLLALLLYAIKIPVAGFSIWLFKTEKEKLLTYRFIKKGYGWLVKFMEYIDSLEAYHIIKDKTNKLKTKLKENIKKESVFIKGIKRYSKLVYRKLKTKLKNIRK